MDTNQVILRILIPTISSFCIGLAITPFFTNIFYRYKLWKRSSRINTEDNPEMLAKAGEIIATIHNEKETSTPRIGGVIIWTSFLLVILLTGLLFIIAPESTDFRFINRSQTLLPLVALLVGAFMGLADDLLQILGNRRNLAIGLPRAARIGIVATLGFVQGYWFFSKLGYTGIELPASLGVIPLGIFFVPFFMMVVLALFSSSVIDGVDGLSGGVLAVIFTAYGFIGLFQGQFSIAIFSFTLMGALLAFLWFNIPPARFYLGETGILALTLPLAVIIFLTNTVVEFIIIGLPLVISAGSSLAQIISRRWFNKKIFKVAPLHHHLEAIGWSREKITMRYWVFSVMCSAFGLILVIIQ
jgi:phospho-N-acetylmuramoyl-pentapeptide-transferase